MRQRCAGAGLVYAGIAAEMRAVLEAKLREIIIKGFPGDGKGNMTSSGVGEILTLAGKCQALALAWTDPGLKTLELLKGLLAKTTLPMVIDAGGLGALAFNPGLLAQKRAPVIVTPHLGRWPV